MLAVDSTERGQFIRVIGIIELVAQRVRVFAWSLIQLKGAFQPQFAFIRIALALFIRLHYCILRFFFTTLFAIHKPQLVKNPSVMWIGARRLREPFFGGRQITLLKACKPEIVGSVGEWRLGRSFCQITYCSREIPLIQIQPTQIVQNVRMIASITADSLKLTACIYRLV